MTSERKWLASILEQSPEVDKKTRQFWIENPILLKERIALLEKRWIDVGNMIHFSVRLIEGGREDYFDKMQEVTRRFHQNFLLSSELEVSRPSSKIKFLDVVLLKFDLFQSKEQRNKEYILEFAKKNLGLKIAPIDLVCLIRKNFSNEELDLMGISRIHFFDNGNGIQNLVNFEHDRKNIDTFGWTLGMRYDECSQSKYSNYDAAAFVAV